MTSGGGVALLNGDFTFSSCTFSGNSAYQGVQFLLSFFSLSYTSSSSSSQSALKKDFREEHLCLLEDCFHMTLRTSLNALSIPTCKELFSLSYFLCLLRRTFSALNDGGGVWNGGGLNTFSQCTFTSNLADNNGGGILSGPSFGTSRQGSSFSLTLNLGLSLNNISTTFDSCTISNNIGNLGGGVYVSGGLWNSSPTMITNCSVTANVALVSGGGIYCDSAESSWAGVGNSQLSPLLPFV